MQHLFALLLAPFATLTDLDAEIAPARVGAIDAHKQEGYLNTLEELIEHFGHALVPFVPQLFVITLHVLLHAIESRAAVKSDKQALIENLALRRVIALMDRYRTAPVFEQHREALASVLCHELTRWERALTGTSDSNTPAVLAWCHVLLAAHEDHVLADLLLHPRVNAMFVPLLTRTLAHPQLST